MSLPVPAAEKTLRLLELLQRNPDGLTPQEFLAQMDLSRSSLFSLLQTLKSLGYVEQSGLRGRYVAGARLLGWRSAGAGESSDLLSAFYQETSNHKLEETVVLVVPNAEACVVLAQIESPQLVRTSFGIGQTIPMDASTPGAIFSTTPAEDIRAQAFSFQQTEEVTEIAFPICSDGYHPDAVLMLSAPAYRLSREKALSLQPILGEIAAKISYRVGAHTYSPYSTDKSPISPTQSMTIEEIKAFLDGPWAARLACMRPDGSLHVVPIWYEFRGGCFYIAAWKDSMWADYLKQSPNVSLTVDEPWPPLRRVFARAKAVPIEKEALPGGLSSFLNRLSKRYLAQSVQFLLTQEEWHPFQLHPENLRGWRGLHLSK